MYVWLLQNNEKDACSALSGTILSEKKIVVGWFVNL
jgi:hypothetical protein